jgi:hypothetical protein
MINSNAEQQQDMAKRVAKGLLKAYQTTKPPVKHKIGRIFQEADNLQNDLYQATLRSANLYNDLNGIFDDLP